MASQTETSITTFQNAFVTNYGSTPSWLQALLAALAAVIPQILAGCGVAANPAAVQQGLTDNTNGTNLQFRIACRQAGVPLRDHEAAIKALTTTIQGTQATDMQNLLTFSGAS